MKKFVTITLAALMLLAFASFAACNNGGGDDPAPAGNFTAAEIWDKVKAVSGFGNMTPVPARDYGDIYGIDSAKVADSAWYMSDNPAVNADECAVFKVSDPAYAAELAKIFEQRIARQLALCETYSPEQAAKLKDVKVFSAGDWVCYCVGDNYTEMMNVFKANIK